MYQKRKDGIAKRVERFFFRDEPEHLYYEKFMQVIPGFEKKLRKEINPLMFNEGNGVGMSISIIGIDSSEHIDKKYDIKHFFLSKSHKERFTDIYRGTKHRRMKLSNRYMAAIYFLSANKTLWKLCESKVGECGIFFKEMKLRGLDLTGYILFMAAKSVYYCQAYIDREELEDTELVDADMQRVIANGLYLLEHGSKVIREVTKSR